MDNLTHSLVGALLGRMGLRRLTGRAMPALIISANLPDIDSFVAPLFGEQSLTAHRGFTHGVGGWPVMALVTAGLVLAWNRWRPAAEPVRFWPLLLVALVGTISHPILDLMNTYGVRLLEPLSDRWLYADTLFIIDPWIWLTLILGLEMSWRSERLGRADWHKPAIGMFAAISAYIGANFLISARAEAVASGQLQARQLHATDVVASPQPLVFWRRRILWRNTELYGDGSYDPLTGLTLNTGVSRTGLNDPRLAATVATNAEARGFLFWARMPIVVIEGGRAFLGDQRFLARRSRSSFLIPLDSGVPAP